MTRGVARIKEKNVGTGHLCGMCKKAGRAQDRNGDSRVVQHQKRLEYQQTSRKRLYRQPSAAINRTAGACRPSRSLADNPHHHDSARPANLSAIETPSSTQQIGTRVLTEAADRATANRLASSHSRAAR
jgi:hypothetical protein